MDLEEEMADRSLFDANNSLNGFGRVHFWGEFDHKIEQFNSRRISLRPIVPSAMENTFLMSNRSRYNNSGGQRGWRRNRQQQTMADRFQNNQQFWQKY